MGVAFVLFATSCLRHTVHLDLSENSLTGTIPMELTLLPKLKFLDLSENNLNVNGGVVPLEELEIFCQNIDCRF